MGISYRYLRVTLYNIRDGILIYSTYYKKNCRYTNSILYSECLLNLNSTEIAKNRYYRYMLQTIAVQYT